MAAEAIGPPHQAHQAVLAGYDAVLFVNHHAGSGGGTATVPFLRFRRLRRRDRRRVHDPHGLHKVFNTAVNFTYPEPPAIGALGEKITATAAFDGWGYVHLYDNTLAGG